MAVETGRGRGSLLIRCLPAIFMPALAMANLPTPCLGSQPRLERLGAATRVGDTAPEGWSHLVIKSIPKLASGDWQDLPRSSHKTATMFRTVILADVQGLGLDKEFILSRVGIGICIPNPDGSDEDLVVSSDRLDALSLKLSTVEEMVLSAADKELAESRIVAFTSSFALLRSPATLLVGGKHQKVDLYYAFCVDPTTGRLRVATWSMWPGDVKQPPPPYVIDVAPRTMFDCKLDVQAKRVVLVGIPFSWSFAMRELPPGRAISIKANKSLGEKIVTIAKHPSDVNTGDFERMLRKVLFAPRDVDKGAQRAQASSKRRAPAR